MRRRKRNSKRGERLKKRDLSLNKYNISKNRYRELLYFCRQYREKKIQLASMCFISSPKLNGMPSGGAAGDPTMHRALDNAALQRDIELIETAAKEAGGNLSEYIITNVCDEIPYRHLNVPCGINQFYTLRRHFFWLLSKNKNGD